ncbi:MAG: type 4a pilus biogenesis protein PilO [Legionellales bacterium]|nr:type 4a pilus biogenesis protein PilO [Legionellales bacterium]
MNMNELTMDNIGSWPFTARLLVIGFVCAIIFVLFFTFDVKPMRAKIAAATASEQDLRSSFQVKYSQVVNRRAYSQQVETLKTEIKTILHALPSQLDVPQLIGDISKVGTQSGLEFNFIKPQPELDHPYYSELPIQISVTGTYAQLTEFITSLAKIPHIVTIDTFSINRVDMSNLPANATPANATVNDLLVMELTAVTYKQNNKKPNKKIAKGGKPL